MMDRKLAGERPYYREGDESDEVETGEEGVSESYYDTQISGGYQKEHPTLYHSNRLPWRQQQLEEKQLSLNIGQLQLTDSSNTEGKILSGTSYTQQVSSQRVMMINDKNFISMGVQQFCRQVQHKYEKQKVREQQQQERQLNDSGDGVEPIGVEARVESGHPVSHSQLDKECVSKEDHQPLEQVQGQQQPVVKAYSTQPQTIYAFHPVNHSSTINLSTDFTEAQQSKPYYDNCKLALTQPITSLSSSITFRLDNLKYCIGFGVGVKEIIEKHSYDYLSTTNNELGHGLYIITTQGYSWSHSQLQQDDVFRGQFWKNLYSGLNISVHLQGEVLTFKCKKEEFAMALPTRIREKYTLCFCAYLHEKSDAASIVQK